MDKWLGHLGASSWLSNVKEVLTTACLVAQCVDRESKSTSSALVLIIIIIRFYIALNIHLKGVSKHFQHFSNPGHWAMIHSLNHLSSLGSIQPVLQNM